MESLLSQRLIFIFIFIVAFFFIVSNPVNGFDIYLPPGSSPDNKPRNSGIYFSNPPKSDNQQPPHSIFSHTQISKSLIHSVVRAKKAGKAGKTVNPELKKICDKTENPDLCISTVAPRLSGGRAKIRDVLEVAIKASFELAKVGNAKAKKLAMSSQGGEDIEDCKGSFDDALDNFNETLGAFKKQDVGTMNSMLSAVVTDMSDCGASLGKDSPLTKIGDKLANMTSNCLGIISQMK